MSVAAQQLKNFNLYLDGYSYAGNIDEVTPPKLALKSEAYRAGGMDAEVEVDMGMEKLELSAKTSKISKETLSLFGLTVGSEKQLVFRGALQSLGGAVEAVEIVMTGRMFDLETDSVAAGSKAGLSMRWACSYYKWTQDGRVLHEIDVLNMKRIINGVDQLSAIRQAIGL